MHATKEHRGAMDGGMMNEIAWRAPLNLIDEALNRELETAVDERRELLEAMRYAVFSGGKRLRSQLTLECAGVTNDAAIERALPAACAIEMIHAYSLVHDDLPVMDNADTRRGRPSCHKKFGEALAILAGDALLTLAFETLTRNTDETNAWNTLRATMLIAKAAGAEGMVGGQAIDIAWSNATNATSVSGAPHASGAPETSNQTVVSGESLMQMHALKTGALIEVSCEVGALLGGGNATQIEAMRCYGAHLGRAFQITDDILDAIGDPRQTGKAATDDINGKATAPQVFGMQGAREMALQAGESAIEALRDLGDEAKALRQLADFVVRRES